MFNRPLLLAILGILGSNLSTPAETQAPQNVDVGSDVTASVINETRELDQHFEHFDVKQVETRNLNAGPVSYGCRDKFPKGDSEA